MVRKKRGTRSGSARKTRVKTTVIGNNFPFTGTKGEDIKRDKERTILLLFLIFVVAALILLFRTPYEDISGQAISNMQLEKTQFNASEKLQGEVTIELQNLGENQKDFIPVDSKVRLYVTANSDKCPLEYVCDDSITTPWHRLENGSCNVYNADPEGACCMRQGDSCKQIIINHEFDKITFSSTGMELPTNWVRESLGPGIEAKSMVDVKEEETVNTIYLSTNYVSGPSKAGFKHAFSTRATPIIEFKGITYGIGVQDGQQELDYHSLNYSFMYDTAYTNGCGFEVVIDSNNSRTLHLFYPLWENANQEPCNYSKQNITGEQVHKYYEMEVPEEEVWNNITINLYKKWTGAFGQGSKEDKVTEISILSYGYYDQEIGEIGQDLYVDYIKLTKTSYVPPSTNCTSGKRCCVEGTGYGAYFGEQLECQEGYECWSKCADAITLRFDDFIRKAFQGTAYKFNKSSTPEYYRTTTISEEEFAWQDGIGYTTCDNTSSEALPPTCRNWTDPNKYTVKLNQSGISLRAPQENGTYEVALLFFYDKCGSYLNDTCRMAESSAPFIVGSGSIPPTNETWVCGNWSSCESGLQYSNCTEQNSGMQELRNRTCCWNCTAWEPTICPIEEIQTRTCVESLTNECPYSQAEKPNETQTCTLPLDPCTVADWDCNDWGSCISGYRSRVCTMVNDCDSNTGYNPETEQVCEESNPLRFLEDNLLLIIIIVVVLVLIVLVLVLKVFKKKRPTQPGLGKGRKGQPQAQMYPEVVSFIKEALASGAQRRDIEQKLLEAGWTKDIIDSSFASLR